MTRQGGERRSVKPRETTGFNRYELEAEGLERVLGKLEAEIMDVVWRESGAVSIREVCEKLPRDLNFNSVMTVMNRLTGKGLLKRRRGKSSYLYRAATSREAFLESISRHVAESLVRDFGNYTVAHIIDLYDQLDPEKLDEMERLIRERRSQRSKGT